MVGILTDWLFRNYIELTAAILGLVYVFLSVRQKIWTWPAGIATSVLYSFVFYSTRFYAGMGLQIYYVVISIYGWVLWSRGRRAYKSGELPVKRATSRELTWGLLIFVITFIVLYLFLKYRTDSPVPLMDALTTSMSIAATWMLARKILENWLIWIVADSASIGLYIFRNLWPTTLLFGVYLALAVAGYYKWKKSMSGS